MFKRGVNMKKKRMNVQIRLGGRHGMKVENYGEHRIKKPYFNLGKK